MNRNILFGQLINEAKKEKFYIGTGNPNAKILLIGKELNIDDIHVSGKKQYQMEVLNNIADWERDSNISQTSISNWDGSNYSPLYPYKGQDFKIDNNNNNGTSRTWYNYQKLDNLIFPNKPNMGSINFHEDFFITEVNADPSKTTRDAIRSTIKMRKEFIKNSEFFQSFPIILIAGLGYFEVSENINEIEDIFGVKVKQKKLAGSKSSQVYWIHNSQNNKKLLINTRQLSNMTSNYLLKEIADVIVKFLYKQWEIRK